MSTTVQSGCSPRGHHSGRAGSTNSPISQRIPSSRAWASRPSVMSQRSCTARRWTAKGIPTRWPGMCVSSTRSASRNPVDSCTTSSSLASTRTSTGSGFSTGSSTGPVARAEASSTIDSLNLHDSIGSTSVAGIQSVSSPSPTRSSSTRSLGRPTVVSAGAVRPIRARRSSRRVGERVLGQGRLTPAHRHPRERPRKSQERPNLPALEPAARRSERAWYLPAAEEPAAPQSRLARAAGGAGRVGLGGQDATSKPCAAALGRDAGSLARRNGSGFPTSRGSPSTVS